ncbi:hypothetical protein P167DRAFT_173266 [Morchella conica CCBAS932]|uniref:Uncharacterized protein n=1 Tax=Morchella conica CCBAS932 TaxID=1392247 RepID=A0A3N4KUI3_9PEZI|nr:hypothetical protein P167DRAFT_173266 [Morchella conica CCBAS932]
MRQVTPNPTPNPQLRPPTAPPEPSAPAPAPAPTPAPLTPTMAPPTPKPTTIPKPTAKPTPSKTPQTPTTTSTTPNTPCLLLWWTLGLVLFTIIQSRITDTPLLHTTVYTTLFFTVFGAAATVAVRAGGRATDVLLLLAAMVGIVQLWTGTLGAGTVGMAGTGVAEAVGEGATRFTAGYRNLAFTNRECKRRF